MRIVFATGDFICLDLPSPEVINLSIVGVNIRHTFFINGMRSFEPHPLLPYSVSQSSYSDAAPRVYIMTVRWLRRSENVSGSKTHG